MNIVICEKNIAANRIASILSKGSAKQKKIGKVPIYEFSINNKEWAIIGLRGHIINLDFPLKFKTWWQIAPRNLITVEPEKKVTEKGIASAIKKLVNDDVKLIVATDFDREGELIGVEAIDLVKKYNKNISDIKRAQFSAITPYEINEAFDKLTEVDYHLSAAGESRQFIDLVWGAVLTRFISLTSNKTGKEFLSIGRVQSPTLALLVEKEKEIQAFVPKPYWRIIAHLKKQRSFDADHANGRFWDEKKVSAIFDKIKDATEAKVKTVKKKTQKEPPPPPFNTTSFIQAASYLRISASQAMRTAEELYMNGLISYPRTDNTVYPKSLDIKDILNKLSQSDHSEDVKNVLQHPRKQPTRGKKKTTDHPPIHPVDAPKKPLVGQSKKVYDLVVKRFLATLSQDAVSETIKATFDFQCVQEIQSKDLPEVFLGKEIESNSLESRVLVEKNDMGNHDKKSESLNDDSSKSLDKTENVQNASGKAETIKGTDSLQNASKIIGEASVEQGSKSMEENDVENIDNLNKQVLDSSEKSIKNENRLHAGLNSSGKKELSVDDLKAKWVSVLDHIETPSVQRSLKSGNAVSISNNVLLLSFLADFHKDIVMKPENISQIEKSLEEVMGQRLQIKSIVQAVDPMLEIKPKVSIENSSINSGVAKQNEQTLPNNNLTQKQEPKGVTVNNNLEQNVDGQKSDFNKGIVQNAGGQNGDLDNSLKQSDGNQSSVVNNNLEQNGLSSAVGNTKVADNNFDLINNGLDNSKSTTDEALKIFSGNLV